MANLSSAWGNYKFDFTKTNLNTPTLRKAWLNQLSDLLMYQTYIDKNGVEQKYLVEYLTELRLDDLADDEYTDIITVEFTATGRWSYRNNMKFFTDEDGSADLYAHVLSADGLVMTVDFKDLESDTYIKDTHQLIIKDGHITHLEDKNSIIETIYPKRYLELGIGDEYDAVSHFLSEVDDLTDEQFNRILTMSAEEFDNWEEIVGFNQD